MLLSDQTFLLSRPGDAVAAAVTEMAGGYPNNRSTHGQTLQPRQAKLTRGFCLATRAPADRVPQVHVCHLARQREGERFSPEHSMVASVDCVLMVFPIVAFSFLHLSNCAGGRHCLSALGPRCSHLTLALLPWVRWHKDPVCFTAFGTPE